MSALVASFRNEWSKLLSRKKYIVFLIIGLVICLLWAIVGQLITNLMLRHGGVLFTIAPTPMGVLPFFLQILVPFLIFMAVTDLITVEGSDSTMKAMVCRPVERWKLYISKIMATTAYAAFYLACIFIISAVLNQIFGRSLTIGALFISLASYALSIVPLAVLATFAAFIAILGKSSTLTMFLLLMIYLAKSVLPVFFPLLSEMLFTSYLGWHSIWVGALPGASRLIHMFVIVFSYGIVFFTAGSLIFDKKDY